MKSLKIKSCVIFEISVYQNRVFSCGKSVELDSQNKNQRRI